MINRGDVYWVDLNPTVGSEIKKLRPCVVVSADPINRARRTVIVVPLSTSAKIAPPITISVSCLDKNVAAVCDQLRSVDKKRLKNLAATLAQEDLELLENALRSVMVL